MRPSSITATADTAIELNKFPLANNDFSLKYIDKEKMIQSPTIIIVQYQGSLAFGKAMNSLIPASPERLDIFG